MIKNGQINIELMFIRNEHDFFVITDALNVPTAVSIRSTFLEKLDAFCELKICGEIANSGWGVKNIEAYEDGSFREITGVVSMLYRTKLTNQTMNEIQRDIYALKNYKSRLPLKFITY